MSSSSSSSSSSGGGGGDPNGWIKNPPTQIVKIYGITTRTTLNEQLGLVLQYNTERSRYIVHLCIGQEQIALKADNLRAASYMDTIRGQYQLLSNDPRIRRQIASVTQQIQQRTGISSPIYIGIGILVFLFVLFYFIGFSKTIMLLSFLLFIGMIIGPDLFGASSSSSSSLLSTIIRNFPHRLETVIRDHFPFGSYIASNKYATMAVFGLMVVLLLQALITPNRPNNTRNNKNPSSSSSSRAPMYPTADLSPVVVVASDGSSTTAPAATTTSPSSLLSYEQKEYYYKLGFDDATTQLDFGTSLPPKPTPPPLLDDEDEDDEEDATRSTTGSRYLNTNTDDDDEFADDSEFATTTTTPPRKTTTPRGTGRNANDRESGSGGGGGSGNTGSNSSTSSSSLYQNISTATSFFVIYKTLSDLARDPTTQRYDINLIQQNIANLDTWRMGVLGFAIYRLVNQFLF